MQQALTCSLARVVMIGIALGVVTLAARPAPCRMGGPHRDVRLVLHAAAEPDAVYLSWWDDGDVRIELLPGELPLLRFTMRARGDDGCRWKGIETLEPIDARHYAYRYDEVLLSCRPGAEPYRKTPRTGLVTVVDE